MNSGVPLLEIPAGILFGIISKISVIVIGDLKDQAFLQVFTKNL